MRKYDDAEKRKDYAAMQVYEDFLLHKSPHDVEMGLLDSGLTGKDLEAAKRALSIGKKEYERQAAGHLYKTDIPDEAVARMLDFDKPLSEQHESVRNAISTLIKPEQHELGSSIYGRLAEKFTGDDFGMMRQGQQAASKALQDAGIPGIKYLDANSRTAGEGTLNFVPFNENLIRILERNSIPTGAQPWKPGEWQGLLGGTAP
jgi:hypothetical protein